MIYYLTHKYLMWRVNNMFFGNKIQEKDEFIVYLIERDFTSLGQLFIP